MMRRVRLTTLLGCAALLLTVAALSFATLLTGSVAPALAAAGVAADATGTPAGSPTPAAVPTISAGSAGSITPAAPTLTGATIALGLTCVTAVIGLIIAVATLSALLRGGYGPFLRAMVFGSKAAKGSAQTSLNDGDSWDTSHTLNYRPGPDARDDAFAPYTSYPYNAYDERASAPGDRSRRRASSRSRRGARD